MSFLMRTHSSIIGNIVCVSNQDKKRKEQMGCRKKELLLPLVAVLSKHDFYKKKPK